MATPSRSRQSTASSSKPSPGWWPPAESQRPTRSSSFARPAGSSPRQQPTILEATKSFAQTTALELVNGPFEANSSAAATLLDAIASNVAAVADSARKQSEPQLRLGMASDAGGADRRIAGGRYRLLDGSAPGRGAVGRNRQRDAPARRQRHCRRYVRLADGGRARADDARSRAFQGKLGGAPASAERASRRTSGWPKRATGELPSSPRRSRRMPRR